MQLRTRRAVSSRNFSDRPTICFSAATLPDRRGGRLEVRHLRIGAGPCGMQHGFGICIGGVAWAGGLHLAIAVALSFAFRRRSTCEERGSLGALIAARQIVGVDRAALAELPRASSARLCVRHIHPR
eukprot:8826634-Alexandrium_andersonii.AAC.1